MPVITLTIIEGSQAYTRVGQLAARCYEHLLANRPELSDGKGNCWLVAGSAYAAAQLIGLNPRLCGGRVRDRDTGEFLFGRGYHYWCGLSDGTIIDSPNPQSITVHNPKQPDKDYVELKGEGRKVRRHAEAARNWLVENIPQGELSR